MEVHHHAHQGHDKKTWKSYFWEFFMLFLAVFCGSIAELQLEHYIENNRERQYIQAFVRDLKADTISIKANIKSNIRKGKGIDSLLLISNLDLTNLENAKKLVNYFIIGTGHFAHLPNTSALTQFKNTGSLRLVSYRKGVIDSILKYDAANQLIVTHNSIMLDRMNDVFTAFYPIADVKILRDSSYTDFFKKTMTYKQIPPLHLSQEKLNIFLGNETRLALTNDVNRSYLQRQLLRATNLLAFLQKEYHLENE